jgi:hypothetical protein
MDSSGDATTDPQRRKQLAGKDGVASLDQSAEAWLGRGNTLSNVGAPLPWSAMVARNTEKRERCWLALALNICTIFE